MSIVRNNLMNEPGYSPYCGDFKCRFNMPRTRFDGEQFACRCGWRSQFPDDFIADYKAKWHTAPNLARNVSQDPAPPLPDRRL